MTLRWAERCGYSPAPTFLATVLLIGLVATIVRAQIPVVRSLPWTSAADRPTWDLVATIRDDPAGNRQAVALGTTVVLPRGPGRWLWLGWGFVAADLGEGGTAARWPAAVDTTAAGDGWPGESVVSGWSRPGVGLLADVRLPLVGGGRLAVGGELPFADNRLYPLAARSVALDLAFRRERRAGPGRWWLGIRRQWQFGAAGDELTDAAFPSLTRATAGLSLPLGPVTVVGEGVWAHHRDGLFTLGADVPVGEGWRLAARWQRDLAPAVDRAFRDVVTVTVRIPAGAVPVPAEEPDGGRSGRPARQPGGRRHEP